MSSLLNRDQNRFYSAAILLLLALSAYAGAANAEQEFRLNLEKGATSAIEIPVNASGYIPLVLITKKDSNIQSLQLRLSKFTGTQRGDNLPVELQIDSKGVQKTKTGYSGIKPDGGLVNIQLKLPKAPLAGNYAGDLFLMSDKQEVLRDWRLILKPALDRNATLVLGRNAMTVPVTLPDEPTVTVHISDKDEKLPLFGVTVRPETLTGDGVMELNWQKQLSFKYNGKPVSDIDQSPSATATSSNEQAARDIAAGQQAKIEIGFHNLKPGRYGIAMRFGASNSISDDKQKLSLTLLVKGSVYYAIAWLVFAIFISYVATKWLTMRRSRLTLLKRIYTLRPAWLFNEPPETPLIWYFATLKQAEDRLQQRVLSVAEVDDLLQQATLMLPILDKIRQLRIGVSEAPYAMLVKRRAQLDIRDLVLRLGRAVYTKEMLASFELELKNLESWLVQASMITRYCTLVEESIDQLLGTLQIDGLKDVISQTAVQHHFDATKDAELKKKVGDSFDELRKKPAQSQLDTSLMREREYSWLKLLWQRREYAEFPVLLELDPHKDLDKIYTVADKAVWQRIKDNKRELRFIQPRINKGIATEAYTGITFEIASGNDLIDKSYLFNHALKYNWTISILQKGDKTPFTLTPQTTEPRVAQFSPRKGTLSAKVEIIHEKRDDPIELSMAENLSIADPWFTRSIRAFDTTELVALIIASGVALLSGLMMFYYKNPTFGSVQDYITLILWGVGVDQTKNFLQTLQQFSSSSS